MMVMVGIAKEMMMVKIFFQVTGEEIEAPKSHTKNQPSPNWKSITLVPAYCLFPTLMLKINGVGFGWRNLRSAGHGWNQQCWPSLRPRLILQCQRNRFVLTRPHSFTAFYGWCHLLMLHGQWEVREEGEFQRAAFEPAAPRDSAAACLTLHFWQLLPRGIDLCSGFSPRDRRTHWICQFSCCPDGAKRSFKGLVIETVRHQNWKERRKWARGGNTYISCQVVAAELIF